MVLKPVKKKNKTLVLHKKKKKKPFLKAPVRFREFSEEEFEEFLADSYSGDFNSAKSAFHNFPYKPHRKRSKVCTSISDVKILADKMCKIPAFAYDTETNTLMVNGPNKKFRCVCITISWGDMDNYLVPLGFLRDEDIESGVNLDLREVVNILKIPFSNPYVTIIGNNLKYDLHVLKRIGIDVVTDKLFDNQLASWICDENEPNGLKENSLLKMKVEQEHFKEATSTIPNAVKKQFGYKSNAKVHDFGLVLLSDGADYALDDPFMSWCLFLGFRQEIVDEQMDKIFYNKMVPFSKVLFEMEEQGATVDEDTLKEMQKSMEKDLKELQYKIYELAGCKFNIGSSPQKGLLLYGIDNYSGTFEEYLEVYKKRQAHNIKKNGLDIDKVKSTFEEKQRDPERCAILNCCFHFPVSGVTKSGAPATDNEAMWNLSQKNYKTNKRKQQGVEMIKLMLEYSMIDKLKTAFADGILSQLYDDGKSHPNFNQTGTDSGRLSCSKPNLQQLPKAEEDAKYQIRSVFVGSLYAISEEGEVVDVAKGEYEEGETFTKNGVEWEVKRKQIIAIDYHNLEMVCLTHFSHDKNLTEMFANDDDAHGSTAVNMFELDCTPTECKKKYPHLRQAAKTLNFLLMYGGGAGLLYNNLKSDHYSPVDLGSKEYLKQYGCRTGKEVAQVYIDKYFKTYEGVAKFISHQKKNAHRYGFVRTVLGRKRRLPDINSRDMGVSSYCERLSVNSAIQGTAGDITSSAQIRVAKEDLLKKRLCYMMIQVHDELVFECPEEFLDECIPIIKHDMEKPFGDNSRNIEFLRADYDTGRSYQEAK